MSCHVAIKQQMTINIFELQVFVNTTMNYEHQAQTIDQLLNFISYGANLLYRSWKNNVNEKTRTGIDRS